MKCHLDVLLVYGDLDPGVAAVLAAHRLHIPIAHVEAGLRDHDVYDTEELNRIVIDKFSRHLFATSVAARENLLNENISEKQIFVVGNTITDALRRHLHLANHDILTLLHVQDKRYGLVTIHREENLTSRENLEQIICGLEQVAHDIPLVFIQYAATQGALKIHQLESRVMDTI